MYKNAILVACLLLTGCAGMFDAIQRDPVRIEKISFREGDRLATVSLSAEKRNVLVSLSGERAGTYCAEPPPEVAKAFDINRVATIKAEGEISPEKKAKLEAESRETIKEAITVLAQRTVLLDIYRTGTYTLCQFYANGAISPAELVKQFDSLSQAVIKAIAQQPAVP
jgi:hypothetical protein